MGNQAHTWLCEHYTPRGHSGQQRQASFLQKWFHTQQLFHVILDTAAAAIQGEHAEAHTQRNIVYRTRFQNVESETFFLGTWIKGPKRRQSRLDGVVHFFCKTLCESLQR